MTNRAPSVLILALLAAVSVQAAQDTKPVQAGKPVLWVDPGAIPARDLAWGNGAKDRMPQPPFTFIEEDTGGTQPKVKVRDAAGREWTAKFGEEVHSAIAASRLVWALGYVAEELYFVERGTIEGVKELERGAEFVQPDGAFTNASFRLRDDASERAEERWTFEKNPFAGSRELSGLAILMTMICNWDIQGERNNRILRSGGVDRYAVTDLGATFGKMGTFPMPRSKWNVADFQKEEFIDSADANWVGLDYEGYGSIDKVPMPHARWFSALASQLTDEQLKAAFLAAGATPSDADGFAARLRAKIEELRKATTSGAN